MSKGTFSDVGTHIFSLVPAWDSNLYADSSFDKAADEVNDSWVWLFGSYDCYCSSVSLL